MLRGLCCLCEVYAKKNIKEGPCSVFEDSWHCWEKRPGDIESVLTSVKDVFHGDRFIMEIKHCLKPEPTESCPSLLCRNLAAAVKASSPRGYRWFLTAHSSISVTLRQTSRVSSIG